MIRAVLTVPARASSNRHSQSASPAATAAMRSSFPDDSTNPAKRSANRSSTGTCALIARHAFRAADQFCAASLDSVSSFCFQTGGGAGSSW
jgi:hypothetical protein